METASVKEKRAMRMEAVRAFDAGENYNVWKAGDKHSMFVRFVHHYRKELAGQSDKITLDLTDRAVESVDRETDILPGLTLVVEAEPEPETTEVKQSESLPEVDELSEP